MNQAHEARRLLRAHRYGALSTLSRKFDGFPFGSITPYLVNHDGSLLILISALAEHTKNILHDPRVSLITHNQRDSHIQTQGRVTVLGNALPEPHREQVELRYLRYFPEAQTYLALGDFSFYRIQPAAIRYINGFGSIHWINMKNYTVAQADAFTNQEEPLLAEINIRQQNTLRQLLQQQHNIDVADAQAVGLDCDGMDVRCEQQTWRLDFPETRSAPASAPLTSLFPQQSE